MHATNRADALRLAPALGLLFILPFPHTVALRLLCLILSAGIALALWRRLAPPPLPLKLPILFWALVSLGSLAVAVDVAYSARELKNEVGYTVAAFVTLFALTRDERSLRWLCSAAAGAFLVVTLSALATLAWKGGWPRGALYAGEGMASNFLVTVAPTAALAAWLWRPSRVRGLLIGGAALVLVAGLVSGQRALWPAFGAQLALVCVWLWRAGVVGISGRRALGALALVIGLVGAGLWASEALRTHSNPAAAASKDLRPRLWAEVGRQLIEHPFQGAGFGQRAMIKAYPQLVPPENPLLWHAHNLVLNYGIYAGLPGVAAILILFAALFLRFWRLALSPHADVRYAGLAGAAMVAGVFVRGCFNDFFVRDGAILFWALAGMLLGYALRRSR